MNRPFSLNKSQQASKIALKKTCIKGIFVVYIC